MNNKSKKILSGMVLFAAVFLAVLRTLPPCALPDNAPADEFSAERAIVTVKAIATAPRLVGSPEYENAAEYLISQLATLGLETDFQRTSVDGERVENVLGRLEGTDRWMPSCSLRTWTANPILLAPQTMAAEWRRS